MNFDEFLAANGMTKEQFLHEALQRDTLEEARKKMEGFTDTYHLSTEQADECLKFCDSYSRVVILLELVGRMLSEDWLTILGREWEHCDNIGHYLDDFLRTPLGDVLGYGPCREMMTPDANKAYDDLPDVLTVYRGCYATNKWGLSWSLSRDVAAKFTHLHRYRQEGQPLLVKARAEKKNVAAVMLDRNEVEIITYRPKHISTSHIFPTDG